MNSNDRKRVAELVRSEFRARIVSVVKEPTSEEIAKEMDSLLTKHRLKDKAAKLNAARKQVAELEKQLSVAVSALAGPKKRRSRRYDGCECHEDYTIALEDVARRNLVQSFGCEKAKADLLAQERKLIAKIEVASQMSDLEKVMKSAGLI